MDLRTRLQSLLDADYTIERELGGGGMSRVFVATEKKLGRRVVIKVLSSELAATLSTGRFEREIQLAASLQQANIVPVLTAGMVDGTPYYTMPYIEGESLRGRLGQGPLTEAEVVSVLRDVARALVYAHERNIVHRDIKPDNVLLSGEAAVVTDFGIAKAITAARAQGDAPMTGAMTQVGTAIGTPQYMAPEQAAGDPGTDHRADLYAFGCVAFELLTGNPPFHGRAPYKLLVAHMSEEAPRVSTLQPGVAPALDALVASCLEKLPENRPQTARDVLRQLESVVSGASRDAPATALNARPVSLLKALAIWAATFVATWILARAAVVGIGLPDWTVTFALVVAGLGLPAVVATWYVQTSARKAMLKTPMLTPGGTAMYSTMATMTIKVAPHVSWARTWRAGAIGGGLTIAALAVVMILRAFGIGPAASLLNAGKIGKDSRVLVAQFMSATTDTSLGTVVAQAMRTSLSQSKAIQLVGPGDVVGGLQRMKLPENTTLDEKTAQILAMRDGIPLIVTGTVSSIGPGYVITANLVRSDSGVALFSVQEAAKGAGDILSAVDKVAKGMRSRIGESLRSIAQAPSLQRATTASLVALREYSRGVTAGDLSGDQVSGKLHLIAALTEDSTFAAAWRKLAVYQSNTGAPTSVIFASASAAYRHRDRLPDDERADVEAYYERQLNTRKAVQIYAEHPSLSPNNRGLSLNAFGEYAAAESLLAGAIAADSAAGRQSIGQLYSNLWVSQLGLGKIDAANRTATAYRRAAPKATVVDRYMAMQAGGIDSLFAVSKALARSASLLERSRLARLLSSLAITRGKLRQIGVLSGTAAAVEDSAKANDDPVGNAARDIVAVSALRGSSAAGIRQLDSLVSAVGGKKVPVLDRPDLAIAQAYAALGRADKARSILTDFERMSTREERLVRWGELQAARGELALAEGRTADAVVAFRSATYSDSGNIDAVQNGRTDLHLARAFDKSNQSDSAIAHYERYQTPLIELGALTFAPMALPIAARRLGELHEAKGDIAKAISNYEAFVKLWKDADPDLQSQVTDIKGRIARLRAAEAKKR